MHTNIKEKAELKIVVSHVRLNKDDLSLFLPIYTTEFEEERQQ